MPYNLLTERWIPVRRKSGRLEPIAPWQIVEKNDLPLAIESPRPDFDGALIQFLTALLQTTAAPNSAAEWARTFDKPWTPDELRQKFFAVSAAFNLDGSGPRFMQDLTLKADNAERVPIGALLIDRIGEEGLTENPNLFAKPGAFDALGFPAVAAALFTLQTNAPSGGRGHLTSIRGGGPLTTILLGQSLFETAWLNVLVENEFLSRFGNPKLRSIASRFPWMAPTRTSESGTGKSTTPEDIHPIQHYWAMPRRIRLSFEPAQIGRCAVTGADSQPVVTHYITRHSGISYEGDFRHPLTPYSLVKPGEPWNPKKMKTDGLPYRDWPLFVTGSEGRVPARVLHAYFQEARWKKQVRTLFAFGYAMDNMKPKCWYQGTTPLIAITAGLEADLGEQAHACVEASEEVRRKLVAQVKEALARRASEVTGDIGATLNAAFWAQTEGAFYETIHALRDALEVGREPEQAIYEGWLTKLHAAALDLFERHSQAEADFGATNVHRVASAWNRLKRFSAPGNARLRQIIGLPGLLPKKSLTKQ